MAKRRTPAQRAASVENLKKARARRALLRQPITGGIKVRGRVGEKWGISTHRPRMEVSYRSLFRGDKTASVKAGTKIKYVDTEMGKYSIYGGKISYSPGMGKPFKELRGKHATGQSAMKAVRAHVEGLRGKRLKKYIK